MYAWSGCYAISHIALLAYVALNGFHSISQYSWECDDLALDENTPLLYCSSTGNYYCFITCSHHDQKYSAKHEFFVSGETYDSLCLCFNLYFYYN